MSAYFVTGTDTAVGKTIVATALLHLARARGQTTLGLKPVAAGGELNGTTWMNDDARALMLASSIAPDYQLVNPIALRAAIAPHIAAEREATAISCAALAQHCRMQLAKADCIVIEGAGGWQVPLNDDESMADLAVALGCPVILVVGVRLGCINHSLLTAAAVLNSGLKLAGWVANHIDANMAAAEDNITTLCHRLPAPLLGRIPWLQDPTTAHAHLHLPD